MTVCAYCDTECVATREHVIPNWYGSGLAKDGWEVFNAKRPTTHLNGQLQIKDVCERCNNLQLGGLDAYAKGIYENYLKVPAYYGESSDFAIDRTRFLRWLLKVCFNSARVHNADVSILRKYRRYMIGLEATPEPIVYVHLITATDFSTYPPSAARRIIGGDPQIKAAKWFRMTQFRTPSDAISTIVQRQVYIDSYCFTVFARDPEESSHFDDLARIESRFKYEFPLAQLIPADGTLKLMAGDVHAAATAESHMSNYPSRYGDGPPSASPEFADMIGRLVDAELKVVFLAFTRDEVDAGEISDLVERLDELVTTRESAIASRQRIVIFATDYDDDSRELWEIPEVRGFLQRIFHACPFIFFLALPGSLTFDLFMRCCCKQLKKREDGFADFDPDEVKHFLQMGFDGLNRVTRRLAISAEINNEISNDVLAMMTGQCKPMDKADLIRRLSRA